MNFEFVDKPEDALKQQEEFYEPVIVQRIIGDHTDYDVWDMSDINDMILDGDISDYNDSFYDIFRNIKSVL